MVAGVEEEVVLADERELQIGQFLWLNLDHGEAVLCIVTDCCTLLCSVIFFELRASASRRGFRFSRGARRRKRNFELWIAYVTTTPKRWGIRCAALG
jgi:hypothetical protein